MTAGQRLIEQGIQQGFQEGEREMLLQLVRQRFGEAVDAGIAQRVMSSSPEQLATWADRLLSAATLSELLAD